MAARWVNQITAFGFACFVALGSSPHRASAQVVPTDIVGLSGSLVITRTGDVVIGTVLAPENTCCVAPQSTWCLAGNLFASAGGTGRVVGVNEYGMVLSSAGDEYGLSVQGCSSISAIVGLNIWTYTGVSPMPGEEFVALGGCKGRYCYAVTSAGRIFRRLLLGCDPTCVWVFTGELAGPTPSLPSSWGQLKVRYR